MTYSKKLNIEIPQGTLYQLEITNTVYGNFVSNLAAYNVKSEVRKHHSANDYMQFTTNTSGNVITLSLGANTSLSFEPGRYYYDVVLVPKTGNNGPFRIQEGVALVTPSITDIY